MSIADGVDTRTSQVSEQTQDQQAMADLLKKMGDKAAVGVVFAAPIERQGITVIPVARVGYGFGAGMGNDLAKRARNWGGGGSVGVKPLGYIEIKSGKTQFVPIVEPVQIIRTVFLINALIIFSVIQAQRQRRQGQTRTEVQTGKKSKLFARIAR